MPNPSLINVTPNSSTAGAVSSQSFTLPQPTVGNYVIVVFFGSNGTDGISSLSLTGVASWTKLYQYLQTANGATSLQIWTGKVTSTAGTSLTVNTTSSQQFTVLSAEGVNITGAADQHATSTSSGSTTWASGTTPTTTNANQIWLSAFMQGAQLGSVNTVSSPTNGYTLQSTMSFKVATSYKTCVVCTYIASAAGAAGNGVTVTNSVSYGAFAITLPGVAGGSSGSLMLLGAGN
jgi:hypothetical protein